MQHACYTNSTGLHHQCNMPAYIGLCHLCSAKVMLLHLCEGPTRPPTSTHTHAQARQRVQFSLISSLARAPTSVATVHAPRPATSRMISSTCLCASQRSARRSSIEVRSNLQQTANEAQLTAHPNNTVWTQHRCTSCTVFDRLDLPHAPTPPCPTLPLRLTQI